MAQHQQITGGIGIGIEGITLNDEEKKYLQDKLVGQVILFNRNFQNRQQLCDLTQQIKECASTVGKAMIIAVDQEGGRVQRFKTDGFTCLPAMRRLGALWDQSSNEAKKAKDAAHAIGYVMAAELRACGVDLSFAPVLDLDYGYAPPQVISDRAFHRDPQAVSQLAESLIDGMKVAGIAHCAKHFPGHGYVKGDSHMTLPVDERTFEAIEKEDMLPYKILKNKLTAVMGAWIHYPKVDNKPAALSSKWIKETLREKLGFYGAVFSDALEMKGAGDSLVDAAEKALEAGCDMVIYSGWQETNKLLTTLKQKGKGDPLTDKSRERLNHLLPKGPALDWDTLQQHPEYIKARHLITALFPSEV